eukprot:8612987-Alexandrium_andersonii.AAC.1
MSASLVGSEMCIRDRETAGRNFNLSFVATRLALADLGNRPLTGLRDHTRGVLNRQQVGMSETLQRVIQDRRHLLSLVPLQL